MFRCCNILAGSALLAIAWTWAAPSSVNAQASGSAARAETCRPSTQELRAEGSFTCLHVLQGNSQFRTSRLYFLVTAANGSSDIQRRAEAGNADAMVRLSHFYRLQGDLPAAEVWVRRASAAGSAEAMYDLANIFENGLAGQSDYSAAYQMFHRSADLGFAPAMSAIGEMNAEGLNGSKDEVQATHWFEMAARYGDVQSMVTTGDRYQFGRGTAADDLKAAYWFRRGFAQGN